MLKNYSNKTPAELVAQFDTWVRVHVQVRDASTIYLARTRNELEVAGPGGQQGGLAINAAAGIVSLPWIGPLYVIGSNPNSLVEFTIFAPGVDIGR